MVVIIKLDNVPKTQHGFLTHTAAAAKSLQLCPTLFDPMDCSLPGSSVHGSLQARVLEWVASAFSVLHIRVLKIELLYVPAISLLAIYPKTQKP